MKKALLFIAAVVPLFASCEALMKSLGRQGILEIHFADGTVPTKAAFPDTNDFLLTITDSKGGTVYDGTYGASNDKYTLDEGTYTVYARSCDFKAPLFDTPQYGDTQVAAIKSGRTTVITLSCVQLNAGIRLRISPSFPAAYPSAVLFLKSTAGKLMYSYTEKRIAYFSAGNVNLEMSDGGVDKTLFTRRLESQQILTLGVNVGSDASKSGVDVQVDTTRNWKEEEFVIGGGDSGKDGGSALDNAYSVPVAKSHAGEEDVWVYGYIVGGDLSSSKCSFSAPFSSRTNLVLASKSSCTDKSSCLSVQLAKGEIRDELNLVDHPDLVGTRVYLKGNLVESYFGTVGLKGTSDFVCK